MHTYILKIRNNIPRKTFTDLWIIEIEVGECKGLGDDPAASPGQLVEPFTSIGLIAVMHVVVTRLALDVDTLKIQVLHARIEESAKGIICFMAYNFS